MKLRGKGQTPISQSQVGISLTAILITLTSIFVVTPAHAQLAPPTKAELDGLIQAHGPQLRFHPEEQYFLDDPAATLDDPDYDVRLISYLVDNEKSPETFARQQVFEIPTSSSTILDDVQPILRQEQVISNDDRYRYVVDFDRELPGDLSRALAFVRAQPSRRQNAESDIPIAGDEICFAEPTACVDLQFWFFYPWNGPGNARADLVIEAVFSFLIDDFSPSCNVPGGIYSDVVFPARFTERCAGTHYSDWEVITVRVLRDAGLGSSIISVLASGHEGFRLASPGDGLLQMDNGHPIAYSAKSTHAQYFDAATQGYKVEDKTIPVNGVSMGLLITLLDYTGEGGQQFDAHLPGNYSIVSSAWPDVDTTTPDWLFYEGRWGEYGVGGFALPDHTFYAIRNLLCQSLDFITCALITLGYEQNKPIFTRKEVQVGKSGLMRRSILHDDAPQNANLGLLRFINAIGAPQNALAPPPHGVGTLSPAFDSNITNYTLELGQERFLGVTAIAAEHNANWAAPSKARVEVRLSTFPGTPQVFECLDGYLCGRDPAHPKANGRLLGGSFQFVQLPPGPSTMEIRVTAPPAEDAGAPPPPTRTYTVNVVRACIPDIYESLVNDPDDATDDGDNAIGSLENPAKCTEDFETCNVNELFPGPGQAQTHNICGVGDEDWVRIDANSGLGTRPANVSIYAQGLNISPGTTRDTRIELYQMQSPPGNPQGPNSLRLIREVDGNTLGRGDWAILEPSCNFGEALDPGTYFAKVTQQNNSSVTEDYVLEYGAPVQCNTFVIDLRHTGSGADPVPLTPPCLNCGEFNYLIGTPIMLEATPAPGWQVAGWSGTDDDSSTSTINTKTAEPGGSGPIARVIYEVSRTVVPTAVDGEPGSLRFAIENFQPTGSGVITFDESLDGQVITISNTPILVEHGMSVSGFDLPNGITISGDGTTQLFSVSASSSFLGLNNLTLANGHAASNGGCIYSESNLSLGRVTMTGCTTDGSGGAVYIEGDSLILDSTFAGNSAASGGGAIHSAGGFAEIYYSTVSGNSLSSETPVLGGAGILANGGLILENSIIAGNESPTCPDLQLQGGTINSGLAPNLIGINECVEADFPAGPLVGTPGEPLNPGINPLGDYGGPTMTMQPFPGSPAIDAAINNIVSSGTDQRGVSRPQGVASDLGAVERTDLDYDFDADGDFVIDDVDNCPLVFNTGQLDTDMDGSGNLCEPLANLTDNTPGSLRDVIERAGPGHVITFDPSASGGTINLTAGGLVIDKALTIDASSLGGGLTISGGNLGFIFRASRFGNLTLDSLTLRDGNGSCVVNSSGEVSIRNTTVASCSDGSSVANTGSGSMTIMNSTLVGGGIRLPQQIGLLNTGQLTLVHTTVSDFASNGIWQVGSGTLDIENSIVAGNFGALRPDILGGVVNASGTNLIGNNESFEAVFPEGPLAGTAANPLNPQLNPLDDYGGLTPTMTPSVGSPAVDAALFTINSPATDQRGVARPQSAANDLGATERAETDIDMDTDGDGIPDGLDSDDDNDGVPDEQDDFPLGRFGDARPGVFAFSFIEALARSGITVGCGGGDYCPRDSVTRAQMAVFLERGINGSDFSPPAATGNLFNDVGAGDFAASFIEQLSSDGITSGCGNNNYCPDAEVTRAQMAVFLLRAKHGSSYSPPAATSVFGDVPLNHWAVHWIEQLAAEGITAGCGGGNYCPESPVTRDQMAVFLVRTFGL